MKDNVLLSRVGEILDARREGRCQEADALEKALDKELAIDAAKEHRRWKVGMIIGLIALIVLMAIFYEYIFCFMAFAGCCVPFMGEALKNGGDVK